MDEQVIAAMARWPDVPAVYGWLSLTEAGQWRLHPEGNALREPESPGDGISSPQILAFINRNYASDKLGQWYFQNGPQRVYVRLDAAPFVLQTCTDASSGRLGLLTHTGRDISRLQALYLDDQGRMYAATELGAALIAGRDLPALVDALQAGSDTDVSRALADCLENGRDAMLRSQGVRGLPDGPFPLRHCSRDALEDALGFRRFPQVPAGLGDAGGPAAG